MISPKSIFLWFGEALPVFIGIIAILKTYKKFPLTSFSYSVIFIGASLILIGAHYSYSLVPLFDWIKSYFGFERNNYDKLGHFFQGFIISIIAREYFIRQKLINSMKLLDFIAFMFAVALSAIWEIIEWIVVIILINFGAKEPASSFLGTQNYLWDAQSDIFFALIGAIIAILFFGKFHKREIEKLLN
jgi:putative membrane protein